MKSNRRVKREAKQLFRLCLVDGSVDAARAHKVVALAIAAGRREVPAVLAEFLRLVRLDCARHTANIESATALPAELQAGIEGGLARRYGPGLTTTFAQRADLIGGVRIQVGSDVWDNSVRAGLEALEKCF